MGEPGKHILHYNDDVIERAYLVGVSFQNQRALMPVEESLDELVRLAETSKLVTVGRTSQHINSPDPNTYIGSGKVAEIKEKIEELEADVVIFDDELSPRHQRQLEKKFGEDIKVIDRTALILDIFAQHASTAEGKLQVELAMLEYRLPRLTRLWTHLARQGGGVGLRGMGETQMEADKRMIGQRINVVKKKLEHVQNHRRRHRAKRQQTELQVVAIVGYTNAGKSTLLNKLTGSDVLAADMLFATLDPTTRVVKFHGGREALFTDTVGFIQKLPTDIVAAFRATLEEITEADVLLHVADATHPHVCAQIEAVEDTLSELEVDHLPRVMALNKMDMFEEGAELPLDVDFEGPMIPVSGYTGEGVADLLAAIELVVEQAMTPVAIKLPYSRGDLMSLFHERGQVDEERHLEDGIAINGRLPDRVVPMFEDYLLAS